jgi:long-chain fatty acid transport protein
MRRSSLIFILVWLVGALACSGTAWAQGYGLFGQSACAMGRAGAGVAAPCPDASGIFFNPAGLSLQGAEIGLGGVLIGPRGSFTDKNTSLDGKLNDHWYWWPNIYFSKPVAGRYALGVGVFAPYGLTTDWPVDFQGRYLGYHSMLQAIYIQPTLAVKLNQKISVGAGVDITYLNVELRQRLDLSIQPLPALAGIPSGATFAQLGVKTGTDFANIDLKGTTWNAGYHLGILIKTNDRVSFGARFLSGQSVHIMDGAITTTQISTPYTLPFSLPDVAPAGTPLDMLLKPQFAAGAPLGNQTASSRLPLPSQFVAGTAFEVLPRVKLMVDYQFTRWSKFDKLVIIGQYLTSLVPENYRDTHGVLAGTEVSLGGKSVLRAGLNIHTAAAPDQTVTPSLPEGWRQEYAIGFGKQLWEKIRFDIACVHTAQPDRAGRTTNGGKIFPTAADNNGTYSFTANTISAALSMRF